MRVIHAIFFNLPALAAVAVAIVLGVAAFGVSMKRIPRALVVLLLVALVLHAAVFFSATLEYVAFPFEGKSVVEGVTLYNAIKYLDGEQPYHPPERVPFRSLVYPPVHEMMLAGAIAVLGPSLAAGRFFSLLCALATCAFAALAVWRHTKSALPAALGGLFFICCYGLCGHWTEQVRNDALLACLLTLGLLLVECAGGRGRLPIAGGIVLLLALYTKQTAVLGPAAVVVWLWSRNRRQAIVWACGFFAAALAVFVAMQLWSGGWFSFYILRVPAGVGIDPKKYDLSSTFLFGTWIALWAAVVYGIPPLVAVFRKKGTDEAADPERDGGRDAGGLTLWMLAFLFAAPLCLLQSLKWGAALNAFVPLAPILGVLGGMAVHGFLRRFRDAPWLQTAVLAGAIMQVAILSYQPQFPGARDREAQERIREWVRASSGDVFVSVFSSQAYLNGKTYYGDNVPIGDLARGGLWHGGDLIEKVERGEFALMVLRPAIEPADLEKAVREYYVQVETIDMRGTVGNWPFMRVFVPKGKKWRPGSSTGP